MIVVWRVTERCNLSCPFCAYDRSLPGQRSEIGEPQVMRFAELLAAYRRATGEEVMVSWLGGEPLLWKPILDVSRRLHGQLGLGVSATTNGSTLHREQVQAEILDSFAELTVSIDGFEDFHDGMRGWKQGWRRLRSSVRQLARERVRLGKALKLRANIVLMRDNVGVIADLCHELAEWGLNEITFNQLGGRDRPEFFPMHRLHPADTATFSSALPDLQNRLAQRGVRLCGDRRYLDRIDASARGLPIEVADCEPGRRFLFIDEKGLAAPCSFTLASLGTPIESLRTVDDLLGLPLGFSAARRSKRDPSCSDCPSTQVFAKFGS